MYMYAEHFAAKGPSKVISCVNDYIKMQKTEKIRKLVLFCDNAFPQNKNRYLFCYLDQVCAKRFVDHIKIVYPVPGHSMMPIDSDFGVIERRKKKAEVVYGPEKYVNMVKDCKKKKIV